MIFFRSVVYNLRIEYKYMLRIWLIKRKLINLSIRRITE